MNQIEITVKIDIQDSEKMHALTVFLDNLNSPKPVADENPAKPATKKPATKKVADEKPATKKVADEKPAETKGIDIATVRGVLAKKVKTHRDDIKAKLTEMEVNNVTAMDAVHYPEFLEFLEGLA